MKQIIKSVGYDQQEIINNILALYNDGQPIDFDPCYNKGGFYKNGKVAEPRIKADIEPLLPGVIKADVVKLSLADMFRCIIFDPPFIVAGKNSKMGKLYGSFASVEELRAFWYESLWVLQRALKKRGILIVKCQDFVNGRRNYIFLQDILAMARDSGLEIQDLFVLLAKTRLIKMKKQQHARKYHSYFLVFRKKDVDERCCKYVKEII